MCAGIEPWSLLSVTLVAIRKCFLDWEKKINGGVITTSLGIAVEMCCTIECHL